MSAIGGVSFLYERSQLDARLLLVWKPPSCSLSLSFALFRWRLRYRSGSELATNVITSSRAGTDIAVKQSIVIRNACERHSSHHRSLSFHGLPDEHILSLAIAILPSSFLLTLLSVSCEQMPQCYTTANKRNDNIEQELHFVKPNMCGREIESKQMKKR